MRWDRIAGIPSFVALGSMVRRQAGFERSGSRDALWVFIATFVVLVPAGTHTPAS